MRRLAAALLLLLVCAPAAAHEVPPSLATLDIGRDAVALELQLPLSELGAALRLPLAAQPGQAIPDHGAHIAQYLNQHVQAHSLDGRAYTLRLESLTLRRTDNVNWTSNDWLVAQLRLEAPPGASTARFTLDDTVIVERVVSHNTLLYLRRDLRNGRLGEQPVPLGLIGFGSTQVTVDASGGGWWQGFARLFVLGLRHIAEEPDHLLFLLVLLLPAPLAAEARRWRRRKSAGASLRTVVGVASGFTVGHSLTLGLAAAGLVTPPARAVETLIAVSILVSAVHAWRPLFPGRELWIAAAFGLVHGLAFAEVLSGLNFDGTTLAVSLLGFNLGIEAMQLLVIAVALPPLLLLGADSRYAGVRMAGAGFATACACGWIAERAFGLRNPLAVVTEWLAPPPAWFTVALCIGSGTALGVLLIRGLRAVGRGPALRPTHQVWRQFALFSQNSTLRR